MMHKTKSAKFSLAIKIASILTCVSVMAVGFASWLILQPATPAAKNGSFEVYDVANAKLSFTDINLDGKIVFGKPATTGNTNWLKPSTAVKNEDLTASMTFKITSDNAAVGLSEYANEAYVIFRPNSEAAISVFEKALNVESPAEAPNEAAISFNITASATYTDGEGETQSVTITQASYDAANDKAVLTIPLTGITVAELSVNVSFNFGWGAHFTPAGENQVPVNPYTYYNGLSTTYNKINADDAELYLGLINALSTHGYDVIVSLDPNSTVADAN